METKKSSFTKQYPAVKEYGQGSIRKHDTVRVQKEAVSNFPFQVTFDQFKVSKCSEKYQQHACTSMKDESIDEEPIDLTTFSNKETNITIEPCRREENNKSLPNASQEVGNDQTSICYPRRRRKRRKFAYTADGKLVLIPNDDILQSPASFSESKQLEILKAAKSLFSKRTRTLYHWMYPNAAKPQIKAAVSSSWESLGAQEKDFYISQVLGRFGFPQSSLMVNPQLGGIKELPLIAETTETKSKSRELQSAISSIMPENPMPPELGSNSLTFEEFEEINELTKKRRGRPPGSSNKKNKYNLTGGTLAQDFKDDPELSQELEQFATMFNLSKI